MDPHLWNKILDNNTKAFTSFSLKNRLINLENVVSFFKRISKLGHLN